MEKLGKYTALAKCIKFLINLMFSRLEKFDEPIFKAVYIGGGGLTSGILIGCHIWGVYIQGGLYMRGE